MSAYLYSVILYESVYVRKLKLKSLKKHVSCCWPVLSKFESCLLKEQHKIEIKFVKVRPNFKLNPSK
ncbi:unnamed protein product, partial [Brassica oleracea]